MYSTIKVNNSATYGYTEYIVDTVSDIKTLPTDSTPGSTALVIDNSSIYILNNNHVWVILG